METSQRTKTRNRIATALASLLLMGMAAPPTSFFHGVAGACGVGSYFLARLPAGSSEAELVPVQPGGLLLQTSAYAADPGTNRIYLAHQLGSSPNQWTEIARVDYGSGTLDGHQPLLTLPVGVMVPCVNLDLVHGKIYWMQVGTLANRGIRRANLDGSNVETIVSGYFLQPALTGRMTVQFAIDPLRGSIVVAPEDYGASGPICPDSWSDVYIRDLSSGAALFYGWIPGHANGIAVDSANGDIYVSDACNPVIHRLTKHGELLGSIPAALSEWGTTNPGVLSVDAEQRKIYWTVHLPSDPDPVMFQYEQFLIAAGFARANLDGSDIELTNFSVTPGGVGFLFTERLNLSACDDGLDNDGDLLADTADPGCSDEVDTTEADDCSDGFDNDGDGFTDFGVAAGNDPGCSSASDGSERGTAVCDDGIDQDGDGLIDFGIGRDPACESLASPIEDPECQDGIDNDGDGDIDFDGGTSVTGDWGLTDIDCWATPWGSSESTPECSDGIDNDGDGTVDWDGPSSGDWTGCTAWDDPSEKETGPSAYRCDNGLDDDGDGKIDYRVDGAGDPHCTSPFGSVETPPSSSCGLFGAEGLALLAVARAVRGIRSQRRGAAAA